MNFFVHPVAVSSAMPSSIVLSVIVLYFSVCIVFPFSVFFQFFTVLNSSFIVAGFRIKVSANSKTVVWFTFEITCKFCILDYTVVTWFEHVLLCGLLNVHPEVFVVQSICVEVYLAVKPVQFGRRQEEQCLVEIVRNFILYKDTLEFQIVVVQRSIPIEEIIIVVIVEVELAVFVHVGHKVDLFFRHFGIVNNKVGWLVRLFGADIAEIGGSLSFLTEGCQSHRVSYPIYKLSVFRVCDFCFIHPETLNSNSF